MDQYSKAKTPEIPKYSAELKNAIQKIQNNEASCICILNEQIVYDSSEKGINPLLSLYKAFPNKLKGALLVDKVIGKAAAMILVLGKVNSVYADIVSISAKEYLEKHGITLNFRLCVEAIQNRNADAICPIEQSVLSVDEAETGYRIICQTLDYLRTCS